jgi:hypothetical protein
MFANFTSLLYPPQNFLLSNITFLTLSASLQETPTSRSNASRGLHCCVMAQKSLNIKELLRQHARRFIESNTICLLYDGYIKASSDSGVNVGLIIGMESEYMSSYCSALN